MNLKKTGRTVCAAVLMALASASASASIVLDGWQLWTTTGATPQIGRLNLTGGTYASGSIIGLGGNASSTAVIGGFSGDSTMWGTIASILNLNFDLRDSAGISLKPELLAGDVLFEAITQNNTTGPRVVGACSF